MSESVAVAAVNGARVRRAAAPLLTIAALAATTAGLYLRDPHRSGSWGFCPLYASTGIYCPGCGGLRAVNDLVHRHVGAAFSSNVVVVSLMPFAIAWLALWTLDRWHGVERRMPRNVVRPVQWTGLTLLVLFSVVRNLPIGAWLAP